MSIWTVLLLSLLPGAQSTDVSPQVQPMGPTESS